MKSRLAVDAAPSGRLPAVLVFESDRPIRALVAEWLQMAGYTFMNGYATAAASDAAAGCDVVLVDVRAPLKSARQAIAHAAAAAPHASIIAMSADALANGPLATDAVARELGVAAVLVKPFGRDALMRALERVQTLV